MVMSFYIVVRVVEIYQVSYSKLKKIVAYQNPITKIIYVCLMYARMCAFCIFFINTQVTKEPTHKARTRSYLE